MNARADDVTFRVAAATTLLLALALRLLAYNAWDIHHSDELMQYLEQGHRLASGAGLIPWESRYGIRNALIPQLLSLPMALGDRIDPTGMAAIHLARATFAALCALTLAGAWGIGAAQSRRHALLALFIAAVWIDAVLLGVVLLSESAATALILCGAALLLDRSGAERRQVLAGFLLALGVLVRLQYAPFVAVLVLASARTDWRLWRHLILGGSAALVLGAVSDLADGRTPFQWIVNNFTMNIAAGRAERFGASGPLEYLRMLRVHLGPAWPLIGLAALFAGARYRPLLLAVIANVAVHSLIAHKEYRFIWLSAVLLMVLGAIGSLNLAERWRTARGRPAGGMAMVLILALGWLAIAILAERSSGGSRSFRGGGVITQQAHEAARHPAVCGIALPEQWQRHVVSAYLGRPVPLYLLPEPVQAAGAPVPPQLAAAANAVIADQPPAAAGGYAPVSCRTKRTLRACLYLRPGGCNAAAGHAYRYEAVLRRDDL